MINFCFENSLMFFSLLLCGIRIAKTLIQELSNCFFASYLMDAMGVVYPQYLLQLDAEEDFTKHILFIKGHYCYKRSLVARGSISPPILSLGAFELQASVFKCTMKANLAATMEPPFLVNPSTKLWCSLSMSHILKHSFPEYFKLAKIATMQVLGSVEDGRTFSTSSLMKSKLRNRLSHDLHTLVKMFSKHSLLIEFSLWCYL
jgi:hypothetical protein